MNRFLVLPALVLMAAMSFAQDIRMGVLLPFRTSSSVGGKMVEFYRGVLMAADSVARARNIGIDVVALDCGATAGDMGYLLAAHDELKECDFIIGPQSATQVPVMADWCTQNDIPMVAPFTTCAVEVLKTNCLYVVSPARTVGHMYAAELFSQLFGKYHVVSLATDELNEASVALSRIIISNLRLHTIGVPQISLSSSDEEIKAALSAIKPNILVVSGASLVSVNRVMSKMSAFCNSYPEYKCSMLGTTEWLNYTQQHIQNYYRFNVYIPATHFRNPANPATSAFERRYLSLFKTDMGNTSPRMATMGFDVAWFFTNAVADYRGDFPLYLKGMYHTQAPLQTGLYFKRVSGGGYTNNAMRFVHYDPTGGIELITKVE